MDPIANVARRASFQYFQGTATASTSESRPCGLQTESNGMNRQGRHVLDRTNRSSSAAAMTRPFWTKAAAASRIFDRPSVSIALPTRSQAMFHNGRIAEASEARKTVRCPVAFSRTFRYGAHSAFSR